MTPAVTLLLALMSAPGVGAAPAGDPVADGIAQELQGEAGFWEAAESYERACRSGRVAGCFHLERLMTAERPTPARFAREQARFAGACDAGDARACYRLGRLFDDAGGFGLEPTRALSLYRKACHLGYAFACFQAAELHSVLFGQEISVIETRRKAKISCDAGFPSACVSLANLVKAGKGGPRDVPRSRELLRRACERGRGDACERLAKRTIWLAKGDAKKAAAARGDLEPLVKALTPSCELGHLPACMAVTRLLLQELPTAQTARAEALKKRVKTRLKRPPRPEPPSEADMTAFVEAYWTRRCHDGSPQACFSWARLLERRDGSEVQAREVKQRGRELVAAELKRRVAGWRTECQAEDAFACLRLAELARKGQLPGAGAGEAERLQARHDAIVKRLKAKWASQARGDD